MYKRAEKKTSEGIKHKIFCFLLGKAKENDKTKIMIERSKQGQIDKHSLLNKRKYYGRALIST
jgi:hypothetical protein